MKMPCSHLALIVCFMVMTPVVLPKPRHQIYMLGCLPSMSLPISHVIVRHRKDDLYEVKIKHATAPPTITHKLVHICPHCVMLLSGWGDLWRRWTLEVHRGRLREFPIRHRGAGPGGRLQRHLRGGIQDQLRRRLRQAQLERAWAAAGPNNILQKGDEKQAFDRRLKRKTTEKVRG